MKEEEEETYQFFLWSKFELSGCHFFATAAEFWRLG
jgi:hypothetical protein